MPKLTKRRNDSRDVATYIKAATSAAQTMLRQLRNIVRAEAPYAAERVKYGMPFYDLHGRLLYFAAHKSHVGVYGQFGVVGSVPELANYRVERGTLRFRLDEQLPTTAMRAAVKARVGENEAQASATA